MTLYKLTSAEHTTKNGTLWGELLNKQNRKTYQGIKYG